MVTFHVLHVALHAAHPVLHMTIATDAMHPACGTACCTLPAELLGNLWASGLTFGPVFGASGLTFWQQTSDPMCPKMVSHHMPCIHEVQLALPEGPRPRQGSLLHALLQGPSWDARGAALLACRVLCGSWLHAHILYHRVALAHVMSCLACCMPQAQATYMSTLGT